MKKLLLSLCLLLILNACSSKTESSGITENAGQTEIEKINDILISNKFEFMDQLKKNSLNFDGKMYNFVSFELGEELENFSKPYSVKAGEDGKTYVILHTDQNGDLQYELVQADDKTYELHGEHLFFSSPKE